MALELSILICTTSARSEVIKPLLLNLNWQKTVEIEILIDGHETDNVGIKRQRLLKKSKGLYIVFVDDDDEISHNYITLILEAAKSGADCIGINGVMTTNGTMERKWFISKEYGSWFTDKNVYYRTPNHISPVKRELALLAGFPPISHGEDYAYSQKLLPHLKTETIIEQPLYHYRFRNDEHK